MTLLVIADDELLASRLPEWRADLLVSCGDVPDDVILRVGEKCACRQIVAVKGNHDSSRSFPAPVQDLHLKTLEICRVRFGGFCGAWKYKPAGHYLFEQAEVEKAMSSFPSVDIFVAHNSPRLFHDQDDEVHSGFTAFTSYIARAQPRLFLHGHQHVQQETTAGRTRIIGTFGYRYLTVPD